MAWCALLDRKGPGGRAWLSPEVRPNRAEVRRGAAGNENVPRQLPAGRSYVGRAKLVKRIAMAASAAAATQAERDDAADEAERGRFRDGGDGQAVEQVAATDRANERGSAGV